MKNQLLSELQEMGQEYTILYVEDEQEMRHETVVILEQFFKNVYTAENGKEGLAVFKEKSIDIVLTDIEMPIMNGLDMSKKIREVSSDVPICIISAFNETEKFTKAIRNGVNSYLLKPIEQASLLHTIYGMLIELKNKENAKKYLVQLQNQKIEKAVQMTAEYFLKFIPSPVFVVDSNKKIVYFNELLGEMLLQKNIKVELGEGVEKIESLFSLDNEEKVSIENIQSNSYINQRILFKNENNILFFIPRKQDIEIETLHGGSIIILNDVTTQMKQIRMIEYQKHKLQANHEILEEFLKRNIFTKTPEQIKKVEKVLEKSAFNEDEALLRRAHTYKTTALDYMSTLGETIEDDLEELSELELDLQSELYEFEYSKKYEILGIIANKFQAYANSLVRLIEFSDLASSVEAVSLYLKELSQIQVDLNGYMIKAVIQSVLDDLINWHEYVFITQATEDIHYLDSSLYNTILELKNSFEKSNSANEDDLDFF